MKNYFIKNYSMTSLFLLIIFLFQLSANVNAFGIEENKDQCRTCHEENELMPADFSLDDVHLKAKLTCASCHGGDPFNDDMEVAMSPVKKFTGVPSKKNIPGMCGKCHSNIDYMRQYQPRISTDQVDQYYKSNHGKKLLSGDQNVAECTSCHTAHGILAVKDARSTVYPLNIPATCNKCHGNKEVMDEYNLESKQYDEYAVSVHGVALLENKDTGAPACNDCHGNHGATPPGFASVSHVCGMCHVNNAEYFQNSKMFAAFRSQDFHSCEQCHGYHKILKPSEELLGDGEESVCVNCHSENDKGFIAGIKMKNSLLTLSNLYDSAKVQMSEVKKIGMNDVEIGFVLQDAKQKLIEAKTLVHTFDHEKVAGKTAEGDSLVYESLKIAQAEFDEYDSRKSGFIYSLIGLFILFIAVYLKLKYPVKN